MSAPRIELGLQMVGAMRETEAPYFVHVVLEEPRLFLVALKFEQGLGQGFPGALYDIQSRIEFCPGIVVMSSGHSEPVIYEKDGAARQQDARGRGTAPVSSFPVRQETGLSNWCNIQTQEESPIRLFKYIAFWNHHDSIWCNGKAIALFLRLCIDYLAIRHGDKFIDNAFLYVRIPADLDIVE